MALMGVVLALAVPVAMFVFFATLDPVPRGFLTALVSVGLGAVAWGSMTVGAEQWRGSSPSRRLGAAVAALSVGSLLAVVVPVFSRDGGVAGALLNVAVVVTLAWLFLAAWCALIRRVVVSDEAPQRRWDWLAFGSPMAAALLLHLLVWWPAGMSSDSFDQWAQVASGRYSDWHPAAHTFLLWLITRVWFSPVAVVVVQSLALSGTAGWLLSGLRRLGVPSAAVWATSVFIAALPGTVIGVVIWKDVAFAALMMGLTGLVMRVAASGGAALERHGFVAACIAVVTWSALVRSNAPLGAFGSLALLTVAYRRQWRPLAEALVVCLVLWLGTRTMVVSAFHVEPAAAKLPWWQVEHLAAHSAAGTELTADERRCFEQLSPDTDGKLAYDPYRIDATVFAPGFQRGVLRDTQPVGGVWASLLRRRPMVNVEHQLLASQSTWQITHPREMWFSTVRPAEDASGTPTLLFGENVLRDALSPEQLAVAQPTRRPKIPVLMGPMMRWLTRTSEPAFSWWAWGGALPLYLLVFGAAVAARRRRDWRWLLVAAPSVLNTVGLLIFSVSSEFRFVAPTFFVGFLVGPLLLLVPARASSPET